MRHGEGGGVRTMHKITKNLAIWSIGIPLLLAMGTPDSTREGLFMTMTDKPTTIPQRKDVPEAHRWKIEHLFASQADWEAQYAKTQQLLAAGGRFHGALNDPQRLHDCLAWEDDVGLHVERLYVYANMRHHEDMTAPQYQALADKATKLSVQANEATSFIAPTLLALSTAQLQKLQDDPILLSYRHALDQIIHQKEHVLTNVEEALLAKTGQVTQAPGKIFAMLNNADLAFPNIKNEHGQEVELTHGKYIEFLESRHRDVRQAAFHAVYDTYAKHKNTLAAALHAHVTKNVFYAQIRKYPSVLAASLDADHIPVAVYDNLVTTIHDHLPLLHRYLAVRKKLLHVNTLHMYDLFAPLIEGTDRPISYAEAQDVIADALAPLGEAYVTLLRTGFSGGWIDVYENVAKRSGAYAWGAYGTHPYVLLNHKDNTHAVFTLAHEMGHALHSYLADEAQTYRNAPYTIFTAEIASTLNETLLMEHLLQQTKVPAQRMALLTHYADSFRSTVFRQTMFAEFERIIHDKVEAGETLTPQLLSTLYYDLNKTYFGNGVEVDKAIEMEWARIPHFYSSFYVYKYATGFSAAAAFAHKIKHEGDPAVQRYLTLLRSGGSDYSIDLLQRAGVDMRTPAPIVEAMQGFEKIVQEMEAYADSLA